VVILKH